MAAGAPGAERRIVREIRPSSAARVSFALSLTLSGIVLVGVVALYALGSVSGALGSMEGFVQDLGFPGFDVRFLTVVPGLALLLLLWSGLMAAVGAVLAGLYNTLAELIGGLEVRIREH